MVGWENLLIPLDLNLNNEYYKYLITNKHVKIFHWPNFLSTLKFFCFGKITCFHKPEVNIICFPFSAYILEIPEQFEIYALVLRVTTLNRNKHKL